MKKGIRFLLVMLMILPITLTTACNRQNESTETVFNKKFMPNIKPGMTYEELVKLIGKPGVEVKDAGAASPGIVHYHWDGGKNSALDAMVKEGKLVEAAMLAPNGNTYRIGEN